jgi:hypothetical protein
MVRLRVPAEAASMMLGDAQGMAFPPMPMSMFEPMLMFMFESMVVEAPLQLVLVDAEPTSVAMDIGAVPMPPPPQAARVVSRAVAAHSGAAGDAWRTRNAFDMRRDLPCGPG